MQIFFLCALLMTSVVDTNMIQNVIVTKFKSKNELIKFFSSPKIYNSYLDTVDAEDIEFNPPISGEKVESPLSLSYYNCPRVNFFPYVLPKTKILQTWNKKDSIFYGLIYTNFITISITIVPFDKDQKGDVTLLFIAKIIKKKFFVPNKALEVVINDFKNIFERIQ